jgi:hypothetical protein
MYMFSIERQSNTPPLSAESPRFASGQDDAVRFGQAKDPYTRRGGQRMDG